jgi:hypothetical protein
VWRILLISLIVLGVLGVAGFAFMAYTSSEYQACYAAFDTPESADRAAAAGEDAGFDAEVGDADSTGKVPVTFETGETEEDARELRDAFQAIVEREGGELRHDRNGCVERPPISGL